jgi:DNA-binding CsgD family transcriptional regulator
VRDSQGLILDRDAELATASAAIAAAAQGHGSLLMVEGPAGIGKTTLLRAICAAEMIESGEMIKSGEPGLRVLTARGLALEQGFSYGIVRQLIEPVRALAAPGEWDTLLDGAAQLARRVFDGAEAGASSVGAGTDAGTGAGTDAGTDAGAVEEGVSHATMHGLYWLVANLAARAPLLLAIDDAHWADAPSLRWLSHLAARVDGLPVLLLLGARSGPAQPEILTALHDYPTCTKVELRPLDGDATATLVRDRLGRDVRADLCCAAHAATGGNPFLLDALVKAVLTQGGAARTDEMMILSLGPQPVADAVLRRVGQFGSGAAELTRALAVLGRPAPLRLVAALAGQELAQAALLADRIREASVLSPAALLEFEHPIVRTAIYDSIPPGERALAHARAAAMLEADGADVELLALHLLRSEPAGHAHAVSVLAAAAATATGRGAADTAAGYLRRALAEPPTPARRPALLLDLGIALASDREKAAVPVLRDAVTQAEGNSRATAALLAAGVLGVWGHHDSATEIAQAGLAVSAASRPVHDRLEAELFANSWLNAATAADAWDRIAPRLNALPSHSHAVNSGRPGRPATGDPVDLHVYDALAVTINGAPAATAMACLAPVLVDGAVGVRRDSLAGVIAVLVLVWNDELTLATKISDAVLADARARGSMNMVASMCSLRSLILLGFGKLREAADDGLEGLNFKLKTSPPLSVAWAATFAIEALIRLGRFAEAEEVVRATEERQPPDGWVHSIMFRQARGSLAVAALRYDEGLSDLRTAAAGWRALRISHPAAAYWRVPAVAAYAALKQPDEAARLASEQLDLARQAGGAAVLGVALRVAAPYADDQERLLTEAIALLEAADSRFEHAVALAELGAYRRKSGHRAAAQGPLRLALDYAERAGAEQLSWFARAELVAAGARPRRAALTGPDSLTSAERQVARLAAEGLSNRQIALHLFITQATVETHLRHTFTKLGITSRAQLKKSTP